MFGELLSADDIVLVARDQVELQVMLDVRRGKYTMKWRFKFISKGNKTGMVD